MPGDEPKRPRTNPGVHQTSEERDLAAIERRRRPVESDEIETVLDRDEDTKPTQIVQFRYDSDPAYAELWDRVTRLKREDRQAIRGVGNASLELSQAIRENPVLEERVDELSRVVESHKTAMSVIKWIAGVLIVTTLGSVIVVATKIFSWGVNTGELEIRMLHLERDVETNRTHIEQIQNRSRRDDAAKSTSTGDKQ